MNRHQVAFRQFQHVPNVRDNVRVILGIDHEPSEVDLAAVVDGDERNAPLNLLFSTARAVWSERNGLDPLDSFPVLEELARRRARRTADAIERRTERPSLVELAIEGDELADVPEPDWLIERWLPGGGLTIAYGPKGNGKTFAVLDMALSIAHGVPFAGRPTRQGRVLYVVGEGAGGMYRRYAAWREHRSATGYAGVIWLPRRINLLAEEEAEELADLARKLDVQLVIVDTLNRCLPGTDEGAKDMGTAVAAADRLRDHGIAIVYVHHAGKDEAKGSRGHTSLIGAADTVLRIERAGNRGVKLAAEFQKDGVAAAPLAFEMREVGRSIVLVPSSGGAASGGRPEVLQAKAAVIAVRKLAEVDGIDAPSRNLVLGAMTTIKASSESKRGGIDLAVGKGWLIERSGPRGARTYSLGGDIPHAE